MNDREKARDLGNKSAELGRAIADVLNDTLDALERCEARAEAAEALAERRGAIVLAADAATRYPEDHEAFGRLSALCERVADAELDEIRAALAEEERE